MPPNVLHVIVFKCYNDVSGVMERIIHKCDSLLVGQHPAEGKTKRIHCHAMVVGYKHTTQHMRDYISDEIFGGANGRGNFSVLERIKEKPRPFYDEGILGTYILKGERPRLKFTNYSEERITIFLAGWASGRRQPPAEANEIVDEARLQAIVEEGDRKIMKRDAFQTLLDDYRALGRVQHTQQQITKWICSQYLKRELPIPRTADRQRYAYSIMMIVQNMTEEEHQWDLD